MTQKKFFHLLFAMACIVCAGWGVWYFFFRQSDEEKIKNALEQVRLCLVKKDPHETPVTAAIQVGAIKKYVTEEVSISIPAYGLSGEMQSDTLVKKILLVHKLLSRIDVRFDGISVHFPADGMAEVRLSAVADYMERSGHYTKRHPLILHFCKQKQDWIICRISDTTNGKERSK